MEMIIVTFFYLLAYGSATPTFSKSEERKISKSMEMICHFFLIFWLTDLPNQIFVKNKINIYKFLKHFFRRL